MNKEIKRIVYGLVTRVRSVNRKRIIRKKFRGFLKNGDLIPIESFSEKNNEVSGYWTRHTVRYDGFISANESMEYRENIWKMYPYYQEFADMRRNHMDEVILDYGCGPGNDLVWFTQMTSPKKIIGMDVSDTSLKNSQFRMALHGVDKEKCRLIKVDEAIPIIPIEDTSVDFVSCQGVLMHTSYPEVILKEFCRVLRPSEKMNNCCIMVYNKESIWYHLYAAYFLRFVDSRPINLSLEIAEKLDVDDIFRRSTDGVDCPLARCWSSEEFIDMAKKAGFKRIEYMGGYTNMLEPQMARDYLMQALDEPRLESEHKKFLRTVFYDKNGYPVRNANARTEQCSIGGVYRLWS